MNNVSSLTTSNDPDQYPEVTQADLDRSTFRVGLQASPRKQSVTLSFDESLIEFFKLKAGEQGYQVLINEILRQAKEQEELQDNLR